MSIFPRARRWSYRDRYFGPFTFAPGSRRWRGSGIILESGGDDPDEPGGAALRLMFRGATLIIALPSCVLRPAREWQEYMTEPARTKAIADGRPSGYWQTWPREFGFSSNEGYLSVKYGRQTHDSTTDQTWGWFYPWTQWRHVRHSLYRLDQRLFADLPLAKPGMTIEQRRDLWDEEREIKERQPTIEFAFLDFDGAALTATCRIEEREWRRGVGWFRWLSLFRRPRVERSLKLDFSGEVGPRKGSWKGGTVGHAVTMRAGEAPREAFQRYCDENELVFLGGPEVVVAP